LCVDGLCCDVACDGTCEQCDVIGNEGVCTLIAPENDPDDECSDGACDGNGACASDQGEICTMGSECLSGLCVDGVCCNNACDGDCEQCDASGNEGSCTPLQADTECRASAGECDAAEACDGTSGQCPADANEPDGTTCSDGVCDGGECLPEGSGGDGGGGGSGGDGGSGGAELPDAEGGCSCRVPGGSDDDDTAWLALLGLGLVLNRRRRRALAA
jgi:MYXO-CTERM domain-containing protein